jgi:hypothetical protein
MKEKIPQEQFAHNDKRNTEVSHRKKTEEKVFQRMEKYIDKILKKQKNGRIFIV